MKLFVFARHAESVLNIERRVNGDPTLDVPLTERGIAEATLLGTQVAQVRLDVCVHTRFPRTRRTAEIALSGREVDFLCEPLLDDIDVGDLDGVPVEEYRAWKHEHPRDAPFPNGESLDDAARRYGAGFERLLALPHERVLIVAHEIPIRYALNAAAGSSELDGPAHKLGNAVPYLFDDGALARAVVGIERLVGKIAA
jgi:broad specificity phosphatase PhoE